MLHEFIGEILANMTQVSDVAPGPLVKSLLNISLQRKSQKTGHPSKPAIFFGPSAGRFREVSLYLVH
jgi:hypothetical protein